MALPLPAVAQSNPTKQSNQPSSLREVYSDWTVSCRQEGAQSGWDQASCQMSQELRDRKSGQLVLAMALPAKPSPDSTDAVIIAPFGLDLAKGIQFSVSSNPGKTGGEQVESTGPQISAPFHTCLPSGCLAKLHMDELMFKALRKGNEARVKMTSVDHGKHVQLTISLKGFTAAERRLKALVARFD